MYLEPNDDHKLCAMDDKKDEPLGVMCEEVYVSEKRVNLLSSKCKVQLTIWVDGEKETFWLPRHKLDKRLLPDLLDRGLTLLDTPENVEAVLDYVLDSDKTAPVVYEHDKLGFYTFENGKTVFLANEVIGDCKKASHYFKPEVTARKGTLDIWLDIVKKEIIGHPNLELALAIGASAPVTHMLQKAKIIVAVPIWSLMGESSTGKTTSVRFMASVYGSPEEGSGLIRNFHATDTAIFAMLQDCGMIHIIDESTIDVKKDRSAMVYGLSMGLDKLRCNPDGSLKERQMFTGTVVITGEQSFLGQSAANLGFYARVVELTLRWTDDPDHAMRISQGVRANYGTAIVPYAKYLLRFQQRPDVLEKGFNQELEKFRAKIGNVSGVEERLLNMYATVTLSARIFNKALGVKLNVAGMRDLLVEVHRKSVKKESLARELYDTIMDEVAMHGQYFPTTSGKRKGQINPFSM